MGFRRSGDHIYRPWCDDCGECKSVRIPLPDYKLSKSQKRVINRNKDLQVSFEKPELNDEYYQLYQNYITARHRDGDMFPPSQEQYSSFLCQSPPSSNSQFICFRLDGRLISIAVVDLLPNGLSAIYTFFDPAEEIRGLGKLAIVWQIQWAQKQGLDFLYLGYWIKECQKMAYKAEYKPIQVFEDLMWQPLKLDL